MTSSAVHASAPWRLWCEWAARLLPESRRGDVESLHRAGTVAAFSCTALVLVPFHAWLGWLVFPAQISAELLPPIAAGLPLALLVPLLLRLTGSVRIAGNLLLAHLFVLFALLASHSGGFLAPPSFWNILLPMSASALLGRRWAVFWTLLCAVEGAALIGLDRSGLVFPSHVLHEHRLLYWWISLSTLAALVSGVGLVYELAKDDAVQRLRAANRLLVEARDEADRASRAKSDFLVNISHEIRTPMTAILGFADILGDEWSGLELPLERMEALGAIQRNGRHLLEVVNDLLDLSKIEAGKLQIERIPFSPVQLLGEAAEILRPRADARGLTLEVSAVPPFPETVLGDPARLRQILLNLLGNAVRFTERGEVRAQFSLAGESSAPSLRLEVIDTGIGIAPAQMRHLFQPFAHADASKLQSYGSTGLRLAVCKRLTELMGGRIEVESEPGHGTRFRVEVPVPSVESDAWLPDMALASGVEPHPPVHDPGTLHVRILLVDDGADNRRLIAHVLGRAGAEVEVAESGELALERIAAAESASKPFQVVLMDMQMPGMDGYTATLRLRAQGYTRPILALTAHAVLGARERCLSAGCDDYATKPIDRVDLIQRIRRLCASPA